MALWIFDGLLGLKNVYIRACFRDEKIWARLTEHYQKVRNSQQKLILVRAALGYVAPEAQKRVHIVIHRQMQKATFGDGR